MRRLSDVSPQNMTSEQLEVYKSITSGPRGQVRGPFSALLHSPDMTRHIEKLGVYIRYNSHVPARQRELAICIIGADWQADYEWYAHAPLVIKAGLPEVALEQIARGENPDLSDPMDIAVSRFTKELISTKRVSDATYRNTVEALGEKGTVDLTGLIGYYTLLAMTLNTFEISVPDDADVPWADKP